MSSEDMTLCSSCGRTVPTANFALHEVQCARNMTKCDVCREKISRSALEEHIQSEHTPRPCPQGCGVMLRGDQQSLHDRKFHSSVNCPLCEKEMQEFQLAKHREEECLKRTIQCSKCNVLIRAESLPFHLEKECMMREVICPYCHLAHSARESVEHEDYCGSRTEICEQCQSRVQLKHWAMHQAQGRCEDIVRERRAKKQDALLAETERLRRHALGLDNALLDTAERMLCDRCGEVCIGAHGLRMHFAHRCAMIPNSQRDVGGDRELERAIAMSLEGAAPPTATLERAIAMSLDDPVVPGNSAPDRGELERAIAMSMETQPPPKTDEDLAIAMSLQQQLGGVPCEFCKTLWPNDLIVQHQLLCPEKNKGKKRTMQRVPPVRRKDPAVRRKEPAVRPRRDPFPHRRVDRGGSPAQRARLRHPLPAGAQRLDPLQRLQRMRRLQRTHDLSVRGRGQQRGRRVRKNVPIRDERGARPSIPSPPDV